MPARATEFSRVAPRATERWPWRGALDAATGTLPTNSCSNVNSALARLYSGPTRHTEELPATATELSRVAPRATERWPWRGALDALTGTLRRGSRCTPNSCSNVNSALARLYSGPTRDTEELPARATELSRVAPRATERWPWRGALDAATGTLRRGSRCTPNSCSNVNSALARLYSGPTRDTEECPQGQQNCRGSRSERALARPYSGPTRDTEELPARATEFSRVAPRATERWPWRGALDALTGTLPHELMLQRQ